MSYQAGGLKLHSSKPCSFEKLHTRKVTELEYLSDMLPQLRQMALGTGEHTLARLLEIAMMEAQLQYEIANINGETK